MFTLEFHRGLTAGLSVLGVIDRVGVLVVERDGAVAKRVHGSEDICGPFGVPVDMLEYRRLSRSGGFEVDALDWRDFLPPTGVMAP
jgi:hypothetical protein